MKKILVTIFQLAVTIAVLYWVYHDPNRRAQMAEAIRDAQYHWVVIAILAYGVVEIAAAFRWYVLLKVQKIHLTLPRLLALFLIGMFYNQFLPGGTGGDIIKSYYLLKETPDKKAGALLAVVFDRFIGLVALVAITGALIGLRYDFLSQTTETRNLLWVLLVVLSASILALLSTFVISGFNLFHSLPEKFPGREKLIEISAANHLCRNRSSGKGFANHAAWSLRGAGSHGDSHWLAQFSHHFDLLPARSHRVLLLQTKRGSRACEIARDGKRDRRSRAWDQRSGIMWEGLRWPKVCETKTSASLRCRYLRDDGGWKDHDSKFHAS